MSAASDRNIVALLSVTLALALVVLQSGQPINQIQAAEPTAPQSCHLREFDLCMASAIVFVQQPANIQINEAEIDKQCKLFKETEDCLDDFTDYCMSPMQNSMVDFMSGGLLETMRQYCTKGSPARQAYLKHGKCINDQRKATTKCLIDFQTAVEKSTANETNWKERPKIMCCAMDRMRNCNDAIVESKCGKDAVEQGNMMVKGLFGKAATVMCDKYKHTSPECTKLLPPKGTPPKGAASKNVLSKLLSTATQV